MFLSNVTAHVEIFLDLNNTDQSTLPKNGSFRHCKYLKY